MAKRLAGRWLSAHAHPEYRLSVYRGSGSVRETRRLPALLRGFRDGKIRIATAQPVPDLGIRLGFDHITLWSRDQKALEVLDQALQKMGCDTTGVF